MDLEDCISPTHCIHMAATIFLHILYNQVLQLHHCDVTLLEIRWNSKNWQNPVENPPPSMACLFPHNGGHAPSRWVYGPPTDPPSGPQMPRRPAWFARPSPDGSWPIPFKMLKIPSGVSIVIGVPQ